MPIAVARIVAVAALVAVAAVTAAPLLLQPGLGLPAWAGIGGSLRLALVLLATGLLLATGESAALSRRLGAAAALLGMLPFASWLVTAGLSTGSASAMLWKLLALRPPPLTSFGVMALGGALWLRRERSNRFDAAAICGTAAACTLFLVCVGHLYRAETLTQGVLAAPSTVLSAGLLFALALATLALHEAGPVAAYEGDDPGAHAKRRLLPAAVLTPVASGFLLLYALDGRHVSPDLAIALVVFANVLVMLLLIDRAGNKLAEVVEAKQQRLRAREAAAKKQGMKDAMTALLNRRGWDQQVQEAERLCRADKLNACVVVIDLDNLKVINDNEGHAAGDAYILRAAHALRTVARQGDTLARMGGDEFAYLSVDSDEEAARAIAARFQEVLRAKRVSASVGYAMRDQRTIAEAFGQADQAMYQQKRARKLRRA